MPFTFQVVDKHHFYHHDEDAVQRQQGADQAFVKMPVDLKNTGSMIKNWKKHKPNMVERKMNHR
jgi:hypothetical protein